MSVLAILWQISKILLAITEKIINLGQILNTRSLGIGSPPRWISGRGFPTGEKQKPSGVVSEETGKMEFISVFFMFFLG